MLSRIIFTSLCEFLTILIALANWKKLSVPYKLIFYQVVLAFIVEAVGSYVQHYYKQPNAWLYNVYIILEVWLLGTACGLLMKKKPVKRLVFILLPIITAYWIWVTLDKGVYSLNNWVIVIAALFYVTFYTVLLFDNSIFKSHSVYKQPLFLIAISILVFYPTIIPLFGLINYLVDNDAAMATKLFYINISASVLRYTLVAIAFYLYARQAKRAYVQQ